ncbi:MAG: hypothetical protein AB1480_05295 [Nitrospirota bacterium]
MKELKERNRHLRETEVIANEILKLIDEAESLLNSGNLSESEKKYDEARSKIETIKISHRAKPLAWRFLWIEIGYLVLLLLLGYLTFKWPNFVLWDGLIKNPISRQRFQERNKKEGFVRRIRKWKKREYM